MHSFWGTLFFSWVHISSFFSLFWRHLIDFRYGIKGTTNSKYLPSLLESSNSGGYRKSSFSFVSIFANSAFPFSQIPYICTRSNIKLFIIVILWMALFSWVPIFVDTFVGFKIRGHSTFLHNPYRKSLIRGYWNSWIKCSTKTMKRRRHD